MELLLRLRSALDARLELQRNAQQRTYACARRCAGRSLTVGGSWQLVMDGWWQLAAVDGWRLVAVGGWRRLAVGGSWRLAVGGPLRRSLRAVLNKKKREKKSGPLRTALAVCRCAGVRVGVQDGPQRKGRRALIEAQIAIAPGPADAGSSALSP